MRNIALFAALALTTACVEGDKDEPATADGVVITWTQGGRIWRSAADGQPAEDLTAALDLSTGSSPAGEDRWVAPSPGGAWLAFSGTRFGCAGECLLRVSADLSEGEAVLPGGVEVSLRGMPAISADGLSVVYAAGDGPHEVDLWRTDRTAAGWSAPVLLTADSSFAHNNMPALSADGLRLSYDCGANPYPEDGDNDACVVNLDGTGWQRLVGPDALPDARYPFVQNPHEGPAGLFFEGSWPVNGDAPETIWTLPTGATTPVQFSARYANAVAPCPLPDGRVAMLWLGGNDAGVHELIVAAADGQSELVLTPGLDVADIGVGCAAAPAAAVEDTGGELEDSGGEGEDSGGAEDSGA